MRDESYSPEIISRMIAECLNCVGVVASPEAFRQLDSDERRAQFKQALEAMMATYYRLAAHLRAKTGAQNVRETSLSQAEPLLRVFQEALQTHGFSDEPLLRSRAIAFLNALGAAMNVQRLGDMLSKAPLPPTDQR